MSHLFIYFIVILDFFLNITCLIIDFIIIGKKVDFYINTSKGRLAVIINMILSRIYAVYILIDYICSHIFDLKY